MLFGHDPAPGHRIHHIHFVGSALQPALQLLGPSDDALGLGDDSDDPFSGARVALLRGSSADVHAESLDESGGDDCGDGEPMAADWDA